MNGMLQFEVGICDSCMKEWSVCVFSLLIRASEGTLPTSVVVARTSDTFVGSKLDSYRAYDGAPLGGLLFMKKREGIQSNI